MTILSVVAVLVLVLVNGFFVAAEFALVRVGKHEMVELGKPRQPPRQRVLVQLDDLSSISPPASSASRSPRSASASSASGRRLAL